MSASVNVWNLGDMMPFQVNGESPSETNFPSNENLLPDGYMNIVPQAGQQGALVQPHGQQQEQHHIGADFSFSQAGTPVNGQKGQRRGNDIRRESKAAVRQGARQRSLQIQGQLGSVSPSGQQPHFTAQQFDPWQNCDFQQAQGVNELLMQYGGMDSIHTASASAMQHPGTPMVQSCPQNPFNGMPTGSPMNQPHIQHQNLGTRAAVSAETQRSAQHGMRPGSAQMALACSSGSSTISDPDSGIQYCLSNSPMNQVVPRPYGWVLDTSFFSEALPQNQGLLRTPIGVLNGASAGKAVRNPMPRRLISSFQDAAGSAHHTFKQALPDNLAHLAETFYRNGPPTVLHGFTNNPVTDNFNCMATCLKSCRESSREYIIGSLMNELARTKTIGGVSLQEILSPNSSEVIVALKRAEAGLHAQDYTDQQEDFYTAYMAQMSFYAENKEIFDKTMEICQGLGEEQQMSTLEFLNGNPIVHQMEQRQIDRLSFEGGARHSLLNPQLRDYEQGLLGTVAVENHLLFGQNGTMPEMNQYQRVPGHPQTHPQPQQQRQQLGIPQIGSSAPMIGNNSMGMMNAQNAVHLVNGTGYGPRLTPARRLMVPKVANSESVPRSRKAAKAPKAPKAQTSRKRKTEQALTGETATPKPDETSNAM